MEVNNKYVAITSCSLKEKKKKKKSLIHLSYMDWISWYML